LDFWSAPTLGCHIRWDIWVEPALALNFGLEEYHQAIFTKKTYMTPNVRVLQKSKKKLLLSIDIQLTIPKIGILAEKDLRKTKKSDFDQKTYMTP
jgi:hypothetical protein